MVDVDFSVDLRFPYGHLTNVHVPHFSVGPSFGPVDTSAVVIVQFSWRLHVGQPKVLHNEA